MSDATTITSLPALEPYPERKEQQYNWLDKLESALVLRPVSLWPRLARGREYRFVKRVNRLASRYEGISSSELKAEVKRLRGLLRKELDNDEIVAHAFALIRELSGRELGMRHYDVQIQGGFALLRGFVAEMQTGEGKTLTAILAAATAAMADIPVHVVSVNDYLAQRDADLMKPVYEVLGLSVGVITHEVPPQARKQAYNCDVTYACNKEIAFDYLRDRIALEGKPHHYKMKLATLQGKKAHADNVVMRGLHFAIVDEADSVLADEAGTPLIISRQTDAESESQWAHETLAIADDLSNDIDFKVLVEQRQVELTATGSEKLQVIGEEKGGVWKSRIRREENIRQALMARHVFKLGDHYLVQDGKVQIVDEYTGRILADRSWSEGLHQLVEAKEGCEVTSRKVPVARMTYQRFFRRYKRLAGMSGTVNEIGKELWKVYGLTVLKIPTHCPQRRHYLSTHIYKTQDEKWEAVIERAVAVSEQGRPVLIGTRSVADSETLSQMLTEREHQHVMLNAAQDEDEADIIAQAGHAGRITVATNMAGRGVDIKLDDGISEIGGLHVILTERHDSRRIDRQLEGRCGRQGDKGSIEHLLSMDDQLLTLIKRPFWVNWTWTGLFSKTGRSLRLFRQAQRKAEKAHARTRNDLMEQDRRLGVMMAFTGGME